MAVNGVTPIIISYAIIPNDHISRDGWLSYDFMTYGGM